MQTVYIAQSTEDSEVLGVYGSLEVMQSKVGFMFDNHKGWGVSSDKREAELLAPDGHRFDTLVVARMHVVEW